MIDYFKRIWNRIKTYFSSNKESLSSINENVNFDNPIMTKDTKKFKINYERNVPKKFKVNYERNVPKKNETFNIVNQSRPLKCGRCGTEKSYTRVGTSWKCKECDYKIKA